MIGIVVVIFIAIVIIVSPALVAVIGDRLPETSCLEGLAEVGSPGLVGPVLLVPLGPPLPPRHVQNHALLVVGVEVACSDASPQAELGVRVPLADLAVHLPQQQRHRVIDATCVVR